MAASPSFDTLALAEELERAGFPPGQDLATKQDLRETEARLDHKLELLRRDVEPLGDRITARLGSLIITCTGLLAALVGLARLLP